jgi:catechol O-methyltransferase
VSLAGLSDIIKVEIGSSDASIKRLHDSGALKHIDLMFLDHYKPAYRPDLKLCEELKLITPGSVLAADNVITPGNPPYLEYVRSSVEEKREAIKKADAEAGPDARFADKTAGQYAKRQGQEQLHLSQGNPNLVYKSELINSFEPTGEPVSSSARKRSKTVRNVADKVYRTESRSPGALARSHRCAAITTWL